MFSLRKHPLSPYWLYCYRTPDGRQKTKSTKCDKRKDAERLKVKWDEQFEKAKKNSLTEVASRQFMHEIRQDFGLKTLSEDTVESFIQRWMEGTRIDSKPATIESYNKVIKEFLNVIEEKSKKSISLIEPSDIEAFRKHRLSQKVSNSTLNHGLKIIRSIFGSAFKQGLIPTNPALAVRLPKVKSFKKEVFLVEEVRQLIATASDDWKTAIYFGVYTAMRLNDVAKLRWSSIDLQNKEITFIESKNDKEMKIVINKCLEKRIHEIVSDEPNGYLMKSLAVKSGGGRSGLSSDFIKLMIKAGIDPQIIKSESGRNQSRKSFHSLRYTCNSLMANDGVTQEVRKSVTGHKSSRVNDHYTRFGKAKQREAVDNLPDF